MKSICSLLRIMSSLVLVLALLSSSTAFSQSMRTSKARRQLSPWLVYPEEKGLERIRNLADILDSFSVFGDPPKEWINACHELHIEVYLAVSGNAAAFDTPGHEHVTLDSYIKACREQNYDGIDLDFEHLDPALQERYSAFLQKVSAALHPMGKKLSHCVGFYPGMENTPPRRIFYDPKVVAETCDLIRVMCYDLYYAPGKGDPSLMERPDTQGMGPTSNYPWAREAMKFWLSQSPRIKLIMGLPAYGNDYELTLKGRGQQVYKSTPQVPEGAPVQRAWLWYERLPIYFYPDRQGVLHLFYASDAESTRAHLATVDELDLPGIGFWHFSSVDDATWKTVRAWLAQK